MALDSAMERDVLLAGVAAVFERRGHQLSAEQILEQAERLEDWIHRVRTAAQLAEMVATGQLLTCVPDGESEPTEFVRTR